MIRRLTLCLVLALAFPSGTALAQVKNIDDQLHEVQAVAGKGASVAEAKKAARSAAVDQVVKALIARSEDEWSRYQAVREGILADLPHFTVDLNMSDKYQEGDLVVVEVSGRVLKGALKERLEELGVVKSLEQTFSAATLPQIAVRVAPQSEAGQLSPSFAAKVLQQHLTHRKLAVVDQESLDRLAVHDRAVVGAAAQAASATLKSDVVLVVTSNVIPTERHGDMQLYQAEVGIEAYINGLPVPFAREVYKSRELAFATTADQDKSQRACVEEAIGGAVEPLMQRVLDELQGEAKRGITISINLEGDTPTLERAEAFLRTQCAEASFTKADGSLLLIGRYHGQLTDLLEKLSAEQDLELEDKAVNSRSAHLIVKRR